MFTGLVETTGLLVARRLRQGDGSLWIQTPAGFTDDVATGDSVSVSGACLTALDITAHGFRCDVSTETLGLTGFSALRMGAVLNLEKSLRVGDRLGGHFVTGHVDGRGRVESRQPDGQSERWTFSAPADLSRLIAAKGSICIDGVSLTVNTVRRQRFSVNLIPHTLSVTSLRRLQPGHEVNLEIDLLARYLVRWHESESESRYDDLNDPFEQNQLA